MTPIQIDQLKATNDKDFAAILKGKPRDEIEMLTAWKLYADTNDVELFLHTVSALGLSHGNKLAYELVERLIIGARQCTSGKYLGDDEDAGIILSRFKFAALQPD